MMILKFKFAVNYLYSHYNTSAIDMDHDLNQLNQLLGDDNSLNMISAVNNLSGVRFASDYRNQQFLFSPVANQVRNRNLGFPLPSPLHANQYYYEEQNELSPDNSHFKHLSHPKDEINKVIQFEEYPKFRSLSAEPSTVQKAQRFSEFPEMSQILKKPLNNQNKSKGLKNLSGSVYKIVQMRKVTTYKEVAEELVHMLNNGDFGDIKQSNDQSKEEQNIKRRVYDALNVLVSANIFQKSGKYIISRNQNLSEKRISERLSNKGSPAQLREQIKLKKAELKEKRQISADLKMKQKLLEQLVQRNRQNKYPVQQQLCFPLVGILHSFLNEDIKIKIDSSKTRVSLSKMGEITHIRGDLDLLVKIGFSVTDHNLEESIESENEDDYFNEDYFIKKQSEVVAKKEELLTGKAEQEKDMKKMTKIEEIKENQEKDSP